MARLEVENLHKSFGPVKAVDGVTFAVEGGEIFVVLGPSGCGKTTVLRCIAGLERPDAGEIRLDGRSLLGLPPEERNVGLVFQNYALFPHLTVEANVAYGLKYGKTRVPRKERRKKVAELLALVGLSGYERRKPHELSEGQKQRVALARALAVSPKVLLLDEPLSALDAALRVELRRELRRILKDHGTTSVYVTHDQEEALVLGDRVGVMREGKLEQVDRPPDLYERPKTLFVAQFLGRANLWPLEALSPEELSAIPGVNPPPGREISGALLFFRPEWAEVGEGPFVAEIQEAEYLGDGWEVRGTVHGLPVILRVTKKPEGFVRFRITRAFLIGAS